MTRGFFTSIARRAWLGAVLLGACGAQMSEAAPSRASSYAPTAGLAVAAEQVFEGAPRERDQKRDLRIAQAGELGAAGTAIDAQPARGPLLIYTASFQLSVFEVEKSQSEAKAMAQALGGFVAQQTQTGITLRVPAARFDDAVSSIERMGKVLARQLEALDVGEQYRDLGLRLKTQEAMRARLEELLARAANVKEALEVEQQLGRVLQEIELLKGQLRSLEERIAYSTLTLQFAPVAQPALDQSAVFRLPFGWLEELGVHSLLEVSR